MTFKSLVRELARREGRRKQTDIAQLSETLKHLFDIAFEDPGYVDVANREYGKRLKKLRAKK
jgi:hypothetical protein